MQQNVTRLKLRITDSSSILLSKQRTLERRNTGNGVTNLMLTMAGFSLDGACSQQGVDPVAVDVVDDDNDDMGKDVGGGQYTGASAFRQRCC